MASLDRDLLRKSPQGTCLHLLTHLYYSIPAPWIHKWGDGAGCSPWYPQNDTPLYPLEICPRPSHLLHLLVIMFSLVLGWNTKWHALNITKRKRSQKELLHLMQCNTLKRRGQCDDVIMWPQTCGMWRRELTCCFLTKPPSQPQPWVIAPNNFTVSHKGNV